MTRPPLIAGPEQIIRALIDGDGHDGRNGRAENSDGETRVVAMAADDVCPFTRSGNRPDSDRHSTIAASAIIGASVYPAWQLAVYLVGKPDKGQR